MQTKETELACPRCAKPLFEGAQGNAKLSACGVCGGVWLSNVASQKIVRFYDPNAMMLADMAAKHATTLGVVAGDAKCPECLAVMARVKIPPTQIEIDVCATHGTWFDRNELQEIVRAIHAKKGGNAPAAFAPRPQPRPQGYVAPPSPGTTAAVVGIEAALLLFSVLD